MAEQTSRLAIILDSTGAKRSADTLATSLERLTTQGEKASTSTDDLGVSFKRLAASAAGALSIGVVIKTVDEWGQVAARIKNALKSVEGDIKNYSMLQERFLEISNRNGKNIADTQLLYIGAATSMQELGYSTEQTVDYIESLSSSMTANASSVNEVLSMQNALNKAMVAGKVAGENWNSIVNATPTLLGDIAKQLEKQNGGIKVTEMEVKKLAADGKISFKLFADAVMAAKDANNALADSMDNTVADGLTRVTNSAKAYYGELNQSLGITRSMSAGLAALSNNFDSVSVVLTSVVGIGAARYLGDLSNKTLESAKSAVRAAVDNKKLAVEKVATTKATIAQIQSEKSLVMTSQQSLNAQLAATKAESQRASLRKQLSANSAELTALTKAETAATNELAAAQARLNVASRALSGAVNVLKSGLALVGGPIGFAMLAGAGLYYYSQQAEQAREKTREFTNEIPDLITNLKTLNKVELDSVSVKLIKNINQLKEDLSTADAGIESLKGTYLRAQKVVDSGKGLSWDRQEAVEAARKASDDLKLAYAERQAVVTKLSLAEEAQTKVNHQLTGVMAEQMLAARQQSDALDSAAPKVKMLADAQSFLAQKLGISTNAMQQFNAQSLLLNYGGEDANKLIEGMKQQVELSKVAGKARAQLAAEQAAKRSGANGDGIKEARELAGIEYDNLENQRESLKTSKTSAKQSRDAGQQMLNQLKEQALAIEDQLRYSGKLTDAGFQRLSFERQIAAIKAKGNKATDDEKSLLVTQSQVIAAYRELEVRQETAKLMEEYRSQQTSIYSEMQKGNTLLVERLTLLDKLKAAGKLTDSEYDTSRNNAIKNTKPTLPQSVTSVTGNLQPTGGELSGTWGGMQQQMNELQKAQEAVNQWQEQQLESYRQYYEGKANLTAEYEARIAETQSTARQANDQIEAQRREINRAATESIMDSIVSITRDGFGEQSAVYKAAFVANKAFAIAQSMLAIQQGIAMAAANPFPMNLAAMASVAAQTASIVSNIQGIAGVGFSKGGYTGGGNKYDPRGIVHAGEFVFTKEATDKIGKENLYRLMNTGTLPTDALKNDQYAMKNIHPANQTTNNSNQESMTQNNITVHSAPITIQGNPDEKTIALIESSQKRAIKQAIDVAAEQIIKGEGKVGLAMRGKYNGRKLD